MTGSRSVTGYLLMLPGLICAVRTAVRWVPGLREGAPKRNVVVLVVYFEVLLFGLALARYLL